MSEVTTFSPRRFLCYVDDEPVTQPGEGDFSVEPISDGISEKEGLYGDVLLSINPSSLYTITLRLQASSPDNKRLTAYYDAMRRDGTGFFKVRLVDVNDTAARFASPKAWVRKVPALTRGKEAGDVEWVLGASNGSLGHEGTTV